MQISAKIEFLDGQKYTIARQMHEKGEGSFTLIDDIPSGNDFKTIGAQSLEFFYPVVAQKELQSFIHITPKNRRDKLSDILGFGEMTSLKTALRELQQSLQSRKPNMVSAAMDPLKKCVGTR
ncbi:hypothetical protein Q7M76_02775 [Candidatus Liberibacter asiaticus]|uniref:Uncharacterized protein n=2 Tax=Liberibacter asiaticus TaxID=34021 RepID=C6XFG1_LIBAP|nr:hypothetical protein [Candidatus Liberibacter asiaticus]ACT57114.1 hypothetical protein CLIBASIA_02640 [Candidatus Liberibacter asiaticus str. psy62]AGH16921.1 hypothetical protein WSI_02755 [Candidatus Liberibacter asiaticus str. gxpsy]ALK07264.1 hypothetical protein CD16_02780 [Candidatus Liberibacter asiaticus]ASK52752.1 hypothetical protein B2I23_02820 [Candidatus Liberibacter asiaticus]AWL14073.1 hypothetical protein DIC79_02845 [Candidatus Liberibacter asiaticus]